MSLLMWHGDSEMEKGTFIRKNISPGFHFESNQDAFRTILLYELANVEMCLVDIHFSFSCASQK